MAKLNLYLNTCSTSFVQSAALEALSGPQDCVKVMAEEYRKRIDLMYHGLEKMRIPCVKPGGAFYLFPDFSEFKPSSYEMGMLLLEKAHVSTAAGVVFGQIGEGHLRLSCANSMENLSQAVERIEKAVNELRRR
jgi:aminotransferase